MMKTTRILALALALALCLFPALAQEETECWELDGGNPPLAPEIRLLSNPSTGYRWTAESDDETVVCVCGHGFSPAREGLMGAGGAECFRLDGAGEGYADITFRYARSWEEEPLYTIVYQVLVTEEMDVCIYQTTFE